MLVRERAGGRLSTGNVVRVVHLQEIYGLRRRLGERRSHYKGGVDTAEVELVLGGKLPSTALSNGLGIVIGGVRLRRCLVPVLQ